MSNKMIYARWLYIMGMKESIALISDHYYWSTTKATINMHIIWYDREKRNRMRVET